MDLPRIVFFILFLTVTLSCGNNDKKEINISEDVKSQFDCYAEFQELYKELLSFKNEADFHSYGFGRGGEYNRWLTSFEEASKEDCKILLIEYGFVFNELKALGLEYLKTKGKENDYTRFLNIQFSPKEITSEPEKDLNAENKIIGKWKLFNSYASGYSIEMHLVLENGFYYEYLPHNDSRNKLSKQGNRYSKVGDENGEYYVLNPDGKLDMFDREGNLDEVGWSAKSLLK